MERRVRQRPALLPQHRMRPEISQLLVPLLCKQLETHRERSEASGSELRGWGTGQRVTERLPLRAPAPRVNTRGILPCPMHPADTASDRERSRLASPASSVLTEAPMGDWCEVHGPARCLLSQAAEQPGGTGFLWNSAHLGVQGSRGLPVGHLRVCAPAPGAWGTNRRNWSSC